MTRAAGRPLVWLDVFTEAPLLGNGLAVVLDADDISEETMLGFAREVNLSETTFVQTSDEEGADYRNRIWTVTAEIPFAGHPSLGTAVAVAMISGIERADFVQETRAGLQQIEVSLEDGLWHASVHQGPTEFGPVVTTKEIAPGLGLDPEQMDTELSGQIASTGLPALLAPVRDLDALAACSPDFDILQSIDDRPEVNAYAFVYERGSRTVRARCFGADLAGIEDPATGSAAGPLVAYLQDCLDISEIVVEQGVEMGRASRLEAKMVDGRPKVGGAVTVLSRGKVYLP